MPDYSERQRIVTSSELHAAVSNKDRAYFDLCLQKGADINFLHNGLTPLMRAVWGEDESFINYVLSKGPDLFVKNSKGMDVFEYFRTSSITQESKRSRIMGLLIKALPDKAPAQLLLEAGKEITEDKRREVRALPAPAPKDDDGGGLNF
jgi:ankyrin repeat protein